MTKLCTISGCGKPRWTSASGVRYTKCEAHTREAWRNWSTPPERQRANRTPETEPKLGAPVGKSHNYPQKPKVRSIWVTVIDHTNDEMFRVKVPVQSSKVLSNMKMLGKVKAVLTEGGDLVLEVSPSISTRE